jgi:hypothetical protein
MILFFPWPDTITTAFSDTSSSCIIRVFCYPNFNSELGIQNPKPNSTHLLKSALQINPGMIAGQWNNFLFICVVYTIYENIFPLLNNIGTVAFRLPARTRYGKVAG